ncbi:hypothetical protein ES708_24302 [subsurface metagenome]|jgi:hypothetical protein
MTENEFQECFIILENKFGKRPIASKEIWYKLFKDYKKEEFKEAIAYYLERIKKFPLIPNIKEYTEHFKKDRTEKSYREALCIANKIDTKYWKDI